MQLRSHPLMNYRGIANWPPTWTKRRGDAFKNILRGEIGVLTQVLPSRIEPDARVFLVMRSGDNSYMGTLLFRDAAFCRLVTAVLQEQIGKTMKEIGDLDMSYTL
jgi:hypothetical protein